jgi:hypothetical protein
VPFLGSPDPVPMYRLNPPSHRPCVPLPSPADELKLQSLKIDGCGPSSFQLKSTIFREVSVCPRGPKAVLFRLAKFLLEALVQSVGKSLLFVMAQLVRHLVTSLLESSNDKSMSAWYASYIEAT